MIITIVSIGRELLPRLSMYQTLAARAFVAPAIFQRTHGDAAEASTAQTAFFGTEWDRTEKANRAG